MTTTQSNSLQNSQKEEKNTPDFYSEQKQDLVQNTSVKQWLWNSDLYPYRRDTELPIHNTIAYLQLSVVYKDVKLVKKGN